MGKVLEFKDKGAVKFIEETIDATNLQRGKDFEVVSIIVMDAQLDAYTLGEFFKTTSNELFAGIDTGFYEKAQLKLEYDGAEINSMFTTANPSGTKVTFYKMKGEIDIDLAIELGLGVVRMDGQYMLYSPYFKDAKDAVYEMIRLKVYAQLANPNVLDRMLCDGFERSRPIIQSLIVMNGQKVMSRLEQIFSGV